MKKVLVAVDGSDESLEAADYAMSIANKEDAQLIIINILDTQPWFYGQSAYGWATQDVLRKIHAHEILEREKILTNIKEKAEKFNIQSKTEVLMCPETTSTASAIVNYAEKEKVDLITIGTRGRTGITRMLLGSVASAVVTNAHCPVMVVKQIRDRLIILLRDERERLVPEIMDWHITECDINRDINLSHLLHFSAIKIQVKYLDHLFRIYIKSMGKETVCRVEESVHPKKSNLETINDIFNPMKRSKDRLLY